MLTIYKYPSTFRTWQLLSLIFCATLLAGCSQESEQQSDPVAKPSDSATQRNYMVAISRPGKLHLIDLEVNQVINQCDLPGKMAPGTVVMSPDTKIAYVLANNFSDVLGIAVDSCEMVFSTAQSSGNERVKSLGSIAISPDGREIYTHQNPVILQSDHYVIQDTRVAVFNTDSGLKAKPVRTFPAPRQVTIMATDASGALYLGGPDIYRMDVNSGEYQVALASRNLDRPGYSQRDVLTVWPIGNTSNEFIRMYTTAKYLGEPGDLNNASWHWGYERIDLLTGEAEDTEFGPLEVVLFSGMTRPGHKDQMYAVLNKVKHFDVPSQTVARTLDLEHTYYCINFSPDGKKMYLGGALSDIAVYDADSFEKLANIQLTGDMSMATAQIFTREL